MLENLESKFKIKLREILISLITYAGFLGLGYIIALFIEIPQVISYSIFLVFGILAVAIDIPDEKMKWLKLIPLVRRHFFMMHRVRRRIGIAAKEGKLISAYKFAVGMIIVIAYLFFMNLAIISIKLILHLTINFSDPFRFTEAFLSLLGAGVTSYIIWLWAFHRDYKYTITIVKFQSRSFKEQIRTVTKGFSLALTLYILFISYIIWITGEFLFMLGTTFYPDYFYYFLMGVGGYFIILVLSLIFIVFFTKPDITLLIKDVESEEVTKDTPEKEENPKTQESQKAVEEKPKSTTKRRIFSRLWKYNKSK